MHSRRTKPFQARKTRFPVVALPFAALALLGLPALGAIPVGGGPQPLALSAAEGGPPLVPSADVAKDAYWEVNPADLISRVTRGAPIQLLFGDEGLHDVVLLETELFTPDGRVVVFLDEQNNVIGEKPITMRTFEGEVLGEKSRVVLSVDSNGIYGSAFAFGRLYDFSPVLEEFVPGPLTVGTVTNRVHWSVVEGPDVNDLIYRVLHGEPPEEGEGGALDSGPGTAALVQGQVQPYADKSFQKEHKDYEKRIVNAFNQQKSMWRTYTSIDLFVHRVYAPNSDYSTSSNCSTMLDAFKSKRATEAGIDGYQLFTGRKTDCLGRATFSGNGVMSSAKTSFVRAVHADWNHYDPDKSHDLGIVSGTELGHNWGAWHSCDDANPSHPCTTNQGKYDIMAGGKKMSTRGFWMPSVWSDHIKTATQPNL